MRKRRKNPEIILRDGKPSAVILDIKYYEELLERLEDIGDLRELQRIRGKRPKFRKFSDFLKDAKASV
jgi:hypothetical protein